MRTVQKKKVLHVIIRSELHVVDVCVRRGPRRDVRVEAAPLLRLVGVQLHVNGVDGQLAGGEEGRRGQLAVAVQAAAAAAAAADVVVIVAGGEGGGRRCAGLLRLGRVRAEP